MVCQVLAWWSKDLSYYVFYFETVLESPWTWGVVS